MENKDKITSTNELIESQDLVDSSNLVEKIEEEIEDLNLSYTDTSSYGGGLSSPPPMMIKVQRRSQYVKGKGFTSVVIHPKLEVEEIKELIGKIQDKQEKYAIPLSTDYEGDLSSPTQGKLQWVPKKQSFKAQVKEKLRKNKHKVIKPKENAIWIVYFDGSRCKMGANVGIKLVNPKGRSFYATYQLQFRCTNNAKKYEALIRGLLFALEKGVTTLKIEGDSQLVIQQVKSIYSCNNKRLLTYQKRVWDILDDFEALNIKSIRRRKNMVVDALAISISALQPVERTKLKIFLVELVVVPSILDNITNFQVFEDDQHILQFIMCNHHFEGQEIDDTPDDRLEDDGLEDEDGILNLKTNTIPKGMVEPKCIFDRDESTLNRRETQKKGIKECDLYNLGTNEELRMVQIGKACNSQEREDILKLLTKYKDAIASSYEELKIYDPKIITYYISLKPDAKLF